MGDDDKGDYEGDHLFRAVTGGSGTRFSQLLFADDYVAAGPSFNCSPSPSAAAERTPKMLCFGKCTNDVELGSSGASTTTATNQQKSGVTCSDSSSASSGSNTGGGNVNTLPPKPKASDSQKKRKRSTRDSGDVLRAAATVQRTSGQTKTEQPTPTGHAKRREKLGDRIISLQQLVSPFGKTDIASVLHEAMGYIKFLHEQVQVLCSPYLQQQQQRLPSTSSSSSSTVIGSGSGNGEMGDLKSRGLCLVPVECTLHVDNSNGADFWSPAMGNSGET